MGVNGGELNGRLLTADACVEPALMVRVAKKFGREATAKAWEPVQHIAAGPAAIALS